MDTRIRCMHQWASIRRRQFPSINQPQLIRRQNLSDLLPATPSPPPALPPSAMRVPAPTRRTHALEAQWPLNVTYKQCPGAVYMASPPSTFQPGRITPKNMSAPVTTGQHREPCTNVTPRPHHHLPRRGSVADDCQALRRHRPVLTQTA